MNEKIMPPFITCGKVLHFPAVRGRDDNCDRGYFWRSLFIFFPNEIICFLSVASKVFRIATRCHHSNADCGRLRINSECVAPLVKSTPDSLSAPDSTLMFPMTCRLMQKSENCRISNAENQYIISICLIGIVCISHKIQLLWLQNLGYKTLLVMHSYAIFLTVGSVNNFFSTWETHLVNHLNNKWWDSRELQSVVWTTCHSR